MLGIGRPLKTEVEWGGTFDLPTHRECSVFGGGGLPQALWLLEDVLKCQEKSRVMR